MSDINELYGNEQVPEVDWDAPESGSSFPAEAAPGTYTFIFHLPESADDQFSSQVVKDKVTKAAIGTYPQVNFNAELLSNGDGQPVPSKADGTQPVARFQRASFYKSPKMPISMGAELIRCLGLVDEVKSRSGGSLNPTVVREVLKAADGRAKGVADFVWRAYFKDTETTVSTRPRKSKGELPWPKDTQGNWEPLATDPATGAKQHGRLEIVSFKVPKS